MFNIGDRVKVIATTDDPDPVMKLGELDEQFGVETGMIGTVVETEVNSFTLPQYGVRFPDGPARWYFFAPQIEFAEGFVPVGDLTKK